MGDVSGHSKPSRQHPTVLRRDGNEMKKPILTETMVLKAAERNNQEARRIAAVEDRVRKNAVELRSALHGNYPGDAEVPRAIFFEAQGRSRSSSNVSSRRTGYGGVPPRPTLDAVPSSMHRESAAAAHKQVQCPSRYCTVAESESLLGAAPDARGQRSSSARPYSGRSRHGLPSLEASLRDDRESIEAGKRKASQQNAYPAGPPSQASRPPRPAVCKCDKCDGPHDTDSCPHYKKPRDKHKDAWANYGAKCPQQMGTPNSHFVLRGGRCVRQPGDGNCLFHSLCFGLNDGRTRPLSAGELRGQLASFIAQHPRLDIAGDSLEEWIKWDTNSSAGNYASRMSRGGWGGGIEMAACSLLKNVNVHVYEKRSGGFKRISCFDCPGKASKTIHVLYQGGVHYDALVPLE